MSKKFTVSVGLLSALAFFLGWYNFAVISVFAIFVVFLCDEEIIKKNVLNAFFLSLIFVLISTVLSFLSTRYINTIDNLRDWEWVEFFDKDVHAVFKKLDIANYILGFVNFVKFVVMIVLFIVALKGNEVKVPLANSLTLKLLGMTAPKENKKADEKNNEEANDEAKEEAKEEENPITSDKATLTEIPKDAE